MVVDRSAQWLSSVVRFVGFAGHVKYLLVVLKPGFGGQQLAALKSDVGTMKDALSASEIIGVIVATGATPGMLVV